jgi:hypothetical protein
MRTPFSLAVILLFAIPCFSQEKPESPKPSATRLHFDSGWLARAHWTSAAFDEASTGYAISRCGSGPNCHERDPLAKPFIGNGRCNARLALGFAAESVAVSFIPNPKLRRIVQIGAIGAHVFLGSRNFHRWR